MITAIFSARRIFFCALLLFPVCMPAQRTTDVMLAGGWSRSHDNYLDAGLRFYRLAADGQAFMAFSGLTAGCEFNLSKQRGQYIPYAGWQGQAFLLAYGARAEYGIDENQYAWGLSLETGLSLIEFMRVTCGYRFRIAGDPDALQSGPKFSLVFAMLMK
ncbi:MAG: hypothetical protein FD123_3020 [Bacteroidetes bacterium]|nr:MAG: hypothetical protein FD123_3020 [Bacteroidota bacterium]